MDNRFIPGTPEFDEDFHYQVLGNLARFIAGDIKDWYPDMCLDTRMDIAVQEPFITAAMESRRLTPMEQLRAVMKSMRYYQERGKEADEVHQP